MKLIERIARQDRTFAKNLIPVMRGYRTKCWEWQGAKFCNGYGRLGTSKQICGRKVHRTHIYSYCLSSLTLKPTDLVLHHCDNKLCCNPSHLYAGDHSQNMRDMKLRTSAKGEAHGNSVLNSKDVSVIKWLFSEYFTFDQLSTMFGVGRNTTNSIKNGKTWNHVDVCSYSRAEFAEYLQCRKVALILPPSKVLYWRNSTDINMAAYYAATLTQQGAADSLCVSRKAIRTAVKSGTPAAARVAKRHAKAYQKWRRKMNTILSLIEEQT